MYTLEYLIANLKACNLLAKAYFTAQLNNLLAHFFHNTHQAKGANMRLRHIKNFLRRSRFHKLLQNLTTMKFWVFHLAPQLTIREGTRPAFAKLHIGLGIENFLTPQTPRILRALAHGLATLKHNGLESHLR